VTEDERSAGSVLQTVVRLLQSDAGALDGERLPEELGAGRLLLLGAAGLALFGAANGLARGGAMIAVAAAKCVAIGAFALVLCAPSLLVLAALAGATWSDRAFLRTLRRFWAVAGVALAALAPVSFLFASSSRYLGSVVLTAAAFEIAAVLLGRRLLLAAGVSPSAGGLWAALVLVVVFQATTLVRPVLVRGEGRPLWVFERRGFVEQLGEASGIRLDRAAAGERDPE
jgi:hypothetical protein